MRTFILLLFATVIFSGQNSFAADYKIKKLSDKAIKNFVEETTEIISKANNTKNTDDVTPFLERHINDSAQFTSKLSYNMPDFPAQDQVLSLSKQDYIDNILQGTANVDQHISTVEVDDIDLSSNKRKATVKTHGTDEAMMQMPDTSGNGGTQNVKVTGTSTCVQEIILNEDDILQMNKADCTTVINFESP